MSKKRGAGNKLSLIMLSLLVLVMLSTTLVGNLLARYAAGSQNRETASVAKFNIVESGVMEMDISDVKFKPGFTYVQPIEVQNNSEVAVEYTLEVSSTGNLPLNMAINETKGNPLVFTQALRPNDSKRSYNLIISWPAEIDDPYYIRMIDLIKLTLSVVQTD